MLFSFDAKPSAVGVSTGVGGTQESRCRIVANLVREPTEHLSLCPVSERIDDVRTCACLFRDTRELV